MLYNYFYGKKVQYDIKNKRMVRARNLGGIGAISPHTYRIVVTTNQDKRYGQPPP